MTAMQKSSVTICWTLRRGGLVMIQGRALRGWGTRPLTTMEAVRRLQQSIVDECEFLAIVRKSARTISKHCSAFKSALTYLFMKSNNLLAIRTNRNWTHFNRKVIRGNISPVCLNIIL